MTARRAWYCYDWANSAFYTTVVTVLFGPYLTVIAKSAAGPSGTLNIAGIPVAAGSLWAYLTTASVLTQLIAFPIVGALADYGRRKREMLGALAFTGAAACMAMIFVDGERWILGCLLFLIANLSFGASIIVYNAFLPEIAPVEERDAVSSRGWAIGYAGGGILLALNLLFLNQHESLGISELAAVRVGVFSAGLWWALFTIPVVIGLVNRGAKKSPPPGEHYITASLKQLAHTAKSLRQFPQTLKFLVAYLIYNDGIQTVILLAGQYAIVELKMSYGSLAKSILITQFVGLAGAIAFGKLAIRVGGRKAVMASLVIWCAALIYMYREVHDERGFFIAAAIIGLVMGGSQALSRSLFSMMIPKGQEAEYFSLYEISDKGSSLLGPVITGLEMQLTGSMRGALLSLIVFFAIGIGILSRVDAKRAALDAGNEAPAIG
jgi:UMF1 family MFS transporter